MRVKALSRRDIIRGAAAVAAITIVPRHVLGGPGQKAPSEKLNIAGVGVGGMGGNNLAFTTTDGSGAHESAWLDEVDFTINGQHIRGSSAVGAVAFTSQPASLTTNENVRVTFSAAVSGAGTASGALRARRALSPCGTAGIRPDSRGARRRSATPAASAAGIAAQRYE